MFLKYALLISILTLRLYAQETVTIQQAIENALKYNGNIKAVEKEKDAVKSEISQAGRFQNPEVEVETENLGSASTSVSVIMPVELGGKRKARIMKARADSMLLSAEYESYRASVVASVHRQFYKALGHQKQMVQLDSLITYAESIKTVIEKHVESGLLGKTELLRSVKDITLLEMERGTLAREYDNSLNLLGTLWGANYGTVKNLSGELHAVRIIRLHDTLKSQLEMSPVLRSSLAGIEAAKAVEAENKSQGYPELMVKGGVIRDSESDVNKFTIGATIGLPIFNRNSSAVIAAGKRSEASDEKSKAVRNELNAKLIECDAAIGMLEYKANELKEKVIPQTEEVLKELRRLFAAGKSSYMELITTQRELVEAWRDYLNTETEIRLVMADIIELTGQSNQE